MRVSTFCALAARGQLFLFTLFSSPISAQVMSKVPYAYQADVKVFEVSHEYEADLLVYVTANRYEAKGNKGIWYFSGNSYNADYTLFFTTYQFEADIKIYFIDQRYQAKWRNPKKHKLL